MRDHKMDRRDGERREDELKQIFEAAGFDVFLTRGTRWGTSPVLGGLTLGDMFIDGPLKAHIECKGKYPTSPRAKPGAGFFGLEERRYDSLIKINEAYSTFYVIKCRPGPGGKGAEEIIRAGMSTGWYYAHLDWLRREEPRRHLGKSYDTGRLVEEMIYYWPVELWKPLDFAAADRSVA